MTTDMFERIVPVMQLIPRDAHADQSLRGKHERILDSLLWRVAESGRSLFFHRWSLSDYNQYVADLRVSDNLRPVSASPELTDGRDGCRTEVITASNITDDEARELCYEVRVGFIQAVNSESTRETGYGFIIMDALATEAHSDIEPSETDTSLSGPQSFNVHMVVGKR